METKNKVATVRKEGVSDSGKPTEAINEAKGMDAVEKPRSVVVYANDVEAYYYSCIAVDWGDVTTFGHTLHKIPTDDLPILISESNPELILENFSVTRKSILDSIHQH